MTQCTFPDHLTRQLDQLASISPVIPVLTIDRLDDAVPLATALVDGGMPVLEVTLRTPCALTAIEAIATLVPEAQVGAGTVTRPEQLRQIHQAGGHFAVSPGATPALLAAGCETELPLLPGVQTVSDIMLALQAGYQRLKFFPAEAAGGRATLNAFGGPFPELRFCPTGGINATNAKDYLALPNVMCVGGTWLAPATLVNEKRWDDIRHLAATAVETLTA